jgi:hypothetical protein
VDENLGIPDRGMERLSYFIQVRLAQLQWTLADLADHGGPAPATLYKARRQDRPLRTATARRLEDALGWAAGSAPHILAGGNPQLAVKPLANNMVGTPGVEGGGGAPPAGETRDAAIRAMLLAVASMLDHPYNAPGDPGWEAAGAHAS